MAFFRRWLLILSVLILGGGQLVTAGTREERAFAAARAAFHDQFYDRAETGLTQFLQNYRKSTNAPQAVLLLSQSEYYLGQFTNAIARLSDTNNLAKAKSAGLADRYVYWTAEAQFAGGDFKAAAETFILLTRRFPDSLLNLSAVVEAASAFEKLGEWPQVDDLLDRTNGLFQRAAQLDPASDAVANGRLLQAKSKIAQKNFAGAIGILNLLNPAMLTPEQAWMRAHQLYQASLGVNDLNAALTATTNLLQIARQTQGTGWDTNLAESVACHAGVLEQQGQMAEAVAAWSENLTNSAPAGQPERAILKMAELAAAMPNDRTNAEADLENYLAQFTNAPATELARLTLGEWHLKDFIAQPLATNQLAVVQTNLDQVSTTSPLAGQAFLDRGWCDWFGKNYADGLADFQAAVEHLPPSTNQAVARFKMGDAQFALANFSGARADYEAVLKDYANLPAVGTALGELALYQSLRANLALNDAVGASNTLARILNNYPEGDLSDNAILLVAEGLDNSNRVNGAAEARGLLEQFEKQFPHSELLPPARMVMARTYEQERNWSAAITNYEGWLRDYPTNELQTKVEYALALANYQAGNESNALAQFTAFISQFPANALTPLADWWVADHFFRLGGTNFVAAESNYQLIFQNFPTNDLACPAQIMAGRAAMGRFDYAGAVRNYFTPLINDTNCPEDLKEQAQFACSAALMQMASTDTNNTSLQQATNLLGQLCPLAATNEAGALAWSEIGDCNLQLGAFDAATNAYAQVLSSPAASAGLRQRAQVGLGMVLEKKAALLPTDEQTPLLKLALDNYLNVFYNADGAGDASFWKKKAGLLALPLMSSLGEGNLDEFLDAMETNLPQLKAMLEKKRAALKN